MHNSKSATHIYINVYITQTNARVSGQNGFLKLVAFSITGHKVGCGYDVQGMYLTPGV